MSANKALRDAVIVNIRVIRLQRARLYAEIKVASERSSVSKRCKNRGVYLHERAKSPVLRALVHAARSMDFHSLIPAEYLDSSGFY